MICDSQEPKKVKDYAVKKFKATIEKLPIGDFANDEKTIFIERKEINDLATAIIGKRWDDQIRTLREIESVVIIEGYIDKDLNKKNDTDPKRKMLKGSLESLDLTHRIPWRQSSDYKNTVNMAYYILEKAKSRRNLDFVVLRKKTDKTIMLFLAIDGVGPKAAVNIANEFGSMANFATNAGLYPENTIEQLCEIPKIGKTKAKTIVDCLNRRYKEK